jgi:type II secretory ATPase GspE/PulE/Tfp pilus assembly ATPase PilB-like protein
MLVNITGKFFIVGMTIFFITCLFVKINLEGRIGIHEVLKISPAIKELIMKGTADDIESQARKEGMMTMIEDGIFEAVKGNTSIEEILRVVSE